MYVFSSFKVDNTGAFDAINSFRKYRSASEEIYSNRPATKLRFAALITPLF
jgi:hypothetical protein